jgi:hypothetical protein
MRGSTFRLLKARGAACSRSAKRSAQPPHVKPLTGGGLEGRVIRRPARCEGSALSPGGSSTGLPAGRFLSKSLAGCKARAARFSRRRICSIVPRGQPEEGFLTCSEMTSGDGTALVVELLSGDDRRTLLESGSADQASASQLSADSAGDYPSGGDDWPSGGGGGDDYVRPDDGGPDSGRDWDKKWEPVYVRLKSPVTGRCVCGTCMRTKLLPQEAP